MTTCRGTKQRFSKVSKLDLEKFSLESDVLGPVFLAIAGSFMFY